MTRRRPGPPETLDRVIPYRGRCGICGGADARHRITDAVASDVRVGMTPEEIANEYRPMYDLSPYDVLVLAAWGASREECAE